MSRFYPFKRKSSVGKDRWYEKLYLSYNMNFNNTYTTKEDQFSTDRILKDGSNGFKHSFSTGASIRFSGILYCRQVYRIMSVGISRKSTGHGTAPNEVVARDTSTDSIGYDVSTKLDLSTQLYGFYKTSAHSFRS